MEVKPLPQRGLLHRLGLLRPRPPRPLHPLFAAARLAGWTAHIREQYADNHTVRPDSEYVGPAYPRSWTPLEARGRSTRLRLGLGGGGGRRLSPPRGWGRRGPSP